MIHTQSIADGLGANRLEKAEWILLASLMVFCFVPSINQLIVDRLISGMGSDVLDVAGQIEWFDLFNETILAFLTVPLYFVFNKVRGDKSRFRSRIMQTMLIGFAAYSLISVAIYAYASNLAAYMEAPDESIAYLRMETIGFVTSFFGSFLYVVLVVLGRWEYIASVLVVKVAMLSLGNLILIPGNGVVGVAMTNITVNAAMSLFSVVLVWREGLLGRRFSFDRSTLHDWFATGACSGLQVLVSNLIYMAVVMKMVNGVSEMGSYWLANNFIWGWLLIPATAFSEIIKRDYYKGYARIWNYLLFMGVLSLIWLASVPLWGPMFTDIVAAPDPQAVLGILYKLVPFYLAYIVCVVLQGVLTSVGRTDYLLVCALIVNIGYYGIVYGLFLEAMFEATLDFVIAMFGFGMVVSAMLNAIFFIHSSRKLPVTVG